MLNDLLKQLKQECEKYGYIYNLPATEKEIESLTTNVKNKFDVDLPDQFIKFLSTTNGIGYDGLGIYSIDYSLMETKPDNPSLSYLNETEFVDNCGFIDNNLIWHDVEENKRYLFFGHDSISWYVLKLAEGTYHVLDKPSGTVMETYDDFDDMLEAALQEKLNQ